MVQPGFPVPEDIIGYGAGHRAWVNCTFFGASIDEVAEKRKAYFDKYPPQGYDTHTDGSINKHPDGYYFVRVVRWSSCD